MRLKQQGLFKVVAGLLISFFSTYLKGQPAAIQLTRLSAEPYVDRILISWEMAAGSTCNGISLHRSADSLHFSLVTEIIGTCGAIDQPVSFFIEDTEPLYNQTTFYRLEFGEGEYSRVVSARLYKIEGDVLLFPNPAGEFIRCVFPNPTRNEVEIDIIDPQGRLLKRFHTEEGEFLVNSTAFAPGLYGVRITNATRREQRIGRFIKN